MILSGNPTTTRKSNVATTEEWESQASTSNTNAVALDEEDEEENGRQEGQELSVTPEQSSQSQNSIMAEHDGRKGTSGHNFGQGKEKLISVHVLPDPENAYKISEPYWNEHMVGLPGVRFSTGAPGQKGTLVAPVSTAEWAVKSLVSGTVGLRQTPPACRGSARLPEAVACPHTSSYA
ncbi:hypothetical protein UY3_10362 [Chelonia mydas]|uniref:Uncharacterized protein n=1 Tax=Chelonia mydas TaxID=8469 RepID=M7BKD4_CHEMY|nr:hypothetical protein UY3_10362 [Chelonia mydas]